MDVKNCSGAVLAGGESSRMGTDKAALRFNGMTLLEWQIQKLRALGLEDIMVSGSTIQVAGTRNVPDLFPHRGPLSGIHACLLAARSAHVLVLGVDIPLVPVSALRKLLEIHTGGITVLSHGGMPEPLIGVYSSNMIAEAETILQMEKPAAHLLFQRTKFRKLEYEGEEKLLMNCNTPYSFNQLQNQESMMQSINL